MACPAQVLVGIGVSVAVVVRWDLWDLPLAHQPQPVLHAWGDLSSVQAELPRGGPEKMASSW